MEKSRLEIKGGLFVLIGLVLLAVLLIQFSKGTSLFRGTYTEPARRQRRRPHAARRRPAGRRAGRQRQGHPAAPRRQKRDHCLDIYKDCPIYHDARFVIEQSGFLGDQYVSVIPTVNMRRLLTNNEDVDCEAPFDLQEVARRRAGFIQRMEGRPKNWMPP